MMAEFREGPPRAFVPVSHTQPGRGTFSVGYIERLVDDIGECPLEVRVESEAAESAGKEE